MEARRGRTGFLSFYLLGAVAASANHLIANWNPQEPTLGASDAIAAVIAAYAMTYPRAQVVVLVPVFIFPLFVPVSALVFAVVWFVIQVLEGTQKLLSTVLSV